MFDYLVLQKALTALLLGLLIGTERERAQIDRKERDFAGIRSFVIITLLGFFAAYLDNFVTNYLIVVMFVGVISLTVSSYLYDSFKRGKKGITAELAAIISYVIGVLSFYSNTYAIILGVVIAIVLSSKNYIHTFVNKISQQEYYATLKFAIIAFVILPILPNFALDPWGVLNLYHIWLMVVFISGISFVGYILTKLIGVTGGVGLTGLVGGLVSSTAVTSSMSNQSKKNKKIVLPFVLAILAASAMMFGRVLIVTSILNPELLKHLILTLGIMIGLNLILVGFFWWRSKNDKQVKTEKVELESPFQFMPALKFGLFFLVILFLIEFANRTALGESGFYLTALISGFADVDAITISMANVARNDPNLAVIAARTITIAVIANTIVKGGIAYLFGGKEFFKYILASITAVVLGGFVGILII